MLRLLAGSLIIGHRTNKEREGGSPEKEVERKVSPLSTVESSFETLNVKKFDVTFAVDPLYYQTTSQFDEGGSKGLLLFNLGVYGGCRVLFDSQEVPEKCISTTNGSTGSDLVDVSFAKECIELMATTLHQKEDISPSLRVLMKQFDEFSLPSRTFDGTEPMLNENAIDKDSVEFNVGKEFFGSSDAAEDIGNQINDAWSADRHYDTTGSNEGVNMGYPTMQNYNEEPEEFMPDEPVVSDSFENVAWLFFEGLGCKLARNAWAGPDHWTYSKSCGPKNISANDSRPNCAAKRPKHKRSLEPDIDFTRNSDEEVSDIFVPVKNPKSLLLPPKRVSCSNKLPEDCHYQPEDLVKLFLLPNVMCLGKLRRVIGPDLLLQGDNVNGMFCSWDNESTVDDPDDDHVHRDVEEGILVAAPRKVDKTEVDYDKTSKQVDVNMLKETLWTLVQGSFQTPEETMHGDAVSFRYVLTAFPDNCKAAATQDISPHLCFICLLHLANEHGLTIVGCSSMDELSIHFPVACEDTGEVK